MRRSRRRGSRRSRWQAKEGLSLINGTQFMTAMAALALVARDAARPRRGHRVRACRSRRCRDADELPPRDPRRSPAAGQRRVAANLRALLDGSAIVESHRWCDKVQDALLAPLRPQVHGASRDLLAYVERTVAVELNAATDNPLVLLDEGLIVSNGNFHGQPIAFALDASRSPVAELASISRAADERLVNPSLSDGLPPFLVARAKGSTRGS